MWGVRPDLTCLGKIIGGGLPVGAYGGRADLMEYVSPAGPVYQAGTLSGNPLAMTAGLWSLARPDARLYTRLARARARSSRPAWPTRPARRASPLQVNALGSLLTPFFTDAPVRDYRLGAPAPTACRTARSSAAMLARGIYPPPSQFEAWFLSAAHTEADVDKTIRAAREAFGRLTSGQWITRDLLATAPLTTDGLPNRDRRVEPQPQHRAGGQLDVLALGCRDGAAAADQDAGERALEAAEDAADDRADAGAGADLPDLTPNPLALDRLGHRRVDRVGAAVRP